MAPRFAARQDLPPLSKAGVFPRTAQAVMRQSRIDLTMNVYTGPVALDIAKAVESLPALTPVVTPKHQSNKSIQADGREILLAPFLAPAVAKTCQNLAQLGGWVILLARPIKTKKPWNSLRKPGFFRGD